MEMPKPTDHHRKLQALAGQWVGQEKMHPSPWDPKGGTVTSRTTSRLDVSGFFLTCDYVQERGGQPSYRGHGVFGWDPKLGRYTMHWFDMMGGHTAPPATGTWEGNTLCLQHESEMGHARYIYEFEGPDAYRFRLEHSQDGRNWAVFLEGRYTRAS